MRSRMMLRIPEIAPAGISRVRCLALAPIRNQVLCNLSGLVSVLC